MPRSGTIDWSKDSERRLLAAVLEASSEKLNYTKIAALFGPPATYDAIEGHFRQIKKIAAQLKHEMQADDRSEGPRRGSGTPRKRPSKKESGVLGGRISKDSSISPGKRGSHTNHVLQRGPIQIGSTPPYDGDSFASSEQMYHADNSFQELLSAITPQTAASPTDAGSFPVGEQQTTDDLSFHSFMHTATAQSIESDHTTRRHAHAEKHSEPRVRGLPDCHAPTYFDTHRLSGDPINGLDCGHEVTNNGQVPVREETEDLVASSLDFEDFGQFDI